MRTSTVNYTKEMERAAAIHREHDQRAKEINQQWSEWAGRETASGRATSSKAPEEVEAAAARNLRERNESLAGLANSSRRAREAQIDELLAETYERGKKYAESMEALRALTDAVRAGYADAVALRGDAELGGLASDPRFQALLLDRASE